MSSKTITDLTDDDEPFNLRIKAPSHRIKNRERYLRAELGFLLCRHLRKIK